MLDTTIPALGQRPHPSPLHLSTELGDLVPNFVADEDRFDAAIDLPNCARELGSFERSGPREMVHFGGANLRAAIVTCGGLCPGLNNVVRAIVLELVHHYRATEVLGYRYGFEGLTAQGVPPISLTLERVRQIHRIGGSMLGVSRGAQSIEEILRTLVRDEIQMLFVIGGDGSLRAARLLFDAATRQGLDISIIGVPKTVDNDVPFVDRTFGFESAVELARTALDSAHAEATSARGGIAIVKLMGRDAGFITATATLASSDVNVCLIPEVPFALDGRKGLLAHLEHRLALRGHALIAVAEGCAGRFAPTEGARDLSGNIRYAAGATDIGPVLRDAIIDHFMSKESGVNVKYIDPSYMLRGVRANATDSMYCDQLGRSAVHAAMAGKTGLLVGRIQRAFVHVPLALASVRTRRVDPEGDLWRSVIEMTGQPPLFQ